MFTTACNLHRVHIADDELESSVVYPWTEVVPEQHSFISSVVSASWVVCIPVPLTLPSGSGVQVSKQNIESVLMTVMSACKDNNQICIIVIVLTNYSYSL